MYKYFAVLCLVTACGGDPSPVEQCDDLVSLLCDRAVECLGGGTHQSCVETLQGEFSCGSTRGVSRTYDRCMDQLMMHSCGVLFPTDSSGDQTLQLPADCMGVILR